MLWTVTETCFKEKEKKKTGISLFAPWQVLLHKQNAECRQSTLIRKTGRLIRKDLLKFSVGFVIWMTASSLKFLDCLKKKLLWSRYYMLAGFIHSSDLKLLKFIILACRIRDLCERSINMRRSFPLGSTFFSR